MPTKAANASAHLSRRNMTIQEMFDELAELRATIYDLRDALKRERERLDRIFHELRRRPFGGKTISIRYGERNQFEKHIANRHDLDALMRREKEGRNG